MAIIKLLSNTKLGIVANRMPRSTGDILFKVLTIISASIVILLMVGIFIELMTYAAESIKKFGMSFLYIDKWDPVFGEFGAISSIYGAVISTLIALVLAIPISIIIALFLVEIAPPRISKIIGTGVELLAAIPSIIYGMWGLFVFAPIMSKYIQPMMKGTLGFLPLFEGPPIGIGIMTAGIILAFMVLPYITSVTRDVFYMVPSVVKEAAYGTGATKWEVMRSIVLPYSLQGIVGACFLGLGRALGETMAVTFVIGNSHKIKTSLFAAGNTIASTLANEFTEAVEPLHLSALVHLALVLFIMTVIMQIASQRWLASIRKKASGK